MPMDMNEWKKNLKNAVEGVADRNLQRRAWLGIGPEQSSPTETFCQFLDDLDIEEHLQKNDVGFNENQIIYAKNLTMLMRSLLPYSVRKGILPENLINDPRMIKIREAAKQFQAVL